MVKFNLKKMNKAIIILLLSILTFSCTSINQNVDIIAQLESLREENDSLKNILAEINNKYVFDSISFRDILNYNNSYDLNTQVEGEIVFVGYNTNKKSRVIFVDSLSTNSIRKLSNPDTIYPVRGGYKYSKTLNSKKMKISAYLECDSDYGKSFSFPMTTLIIANDK